MSIADDRRTSFLEQVPYNRASRPLGDSERLTPALLIARYWSPRPPGCWHPPRSGRGGHTDTPFHADPIWPPPPRRYHQAPNTNGSQYHGMAVDTPGSVDNREPAIGGLWGAKRAAQSPRQKRCSQPALATHQPGVEQPPCLGIEAPLLEQGRQIQPGAEPRPRTASAPRRPRHCPMPCHRPPAGNTAVGAGTLDRQAPVAQQEGEQDRLDEPSIATQALCTP